jgi:hypothetical protein
MARDMDCRKYHGCVGVCLQVFGFDASKIRGEQSVYHASSDNQFKFARLE